MSISHYLCLVSGEDPARVSRLHHSTRRRIQVFAVALHLPVAMWAITGYLIASRIFEMHTTQASLVAALCAGIVYLLERLVLGTPKSWAVSCVRVAVGLVVAVLGATAADLVAFQREIEQQLRADGAVRIAADYDQRLAAQKEVLEVRRTEWMQAQAAARCEADGTCGSRVRSTGPVYRELARHAQQLRQDHEAALANLEALKAQREAALADWATSPRALQEAGLLARVEALHTFIRQNPAAQKAWLAVLVLMLALELTVVFVKAVFGETVDDRIEAIREALSRHKAESYLQAMTDPAAGVRELLSSQP